MSIEIFVTLRIDIKFAFIFMRKLLLMTALMLLNVVSAMSQRVDTVAVYSPSMQTMVNNVVIVPEGYSEEMEYPVLYLLHGHGGHHLKWLEIRPDLPDMVGGIEPVIVVCPDGRNSWYWDSPVNPSSQYETYMTSELISYIDSAYSTVASPDGRAVTGLSMGGHGGLWLGFRHPEIYGACGATSGGVDIRPFPEYWNMKDQLGPQAENMAVWDAHTVMTQLDSIRPGLVITFDCGTEDVFTGVNESLHRELMARKVPHTYVSSPGGHNAPYWHESIVRQLRFFRDFFAKDRK